MKYITKEVTTSGEEDLFIFQLLSSFQTIFGERASITETEPFYTLSNRIFYKDKATDIENQTYMGTATYTATILIDGIFQLQLKRGGTGNQQSLTWSFVFNDNTVVSGPIFYVSGSKAYNVKAQRTHFLKVIEDDNILIVQIGGCNENSNHRSLTVIKLKKNNFYTVSGVCLSGTGKNIPQFSDYFLNSNTFYELGSSSQYKLTNKFNYAYDSGNQIEMASNKILLANSIVKATFPDLYDCSTIPANLFYTLNDEQFLALNEHTLLKINNGFNVVNTLVQTQTNNTTNTGESSNPENTGTETENTDAGTIEEQQQSSNG